MAAVAVAVGAVAVVAAAAAAIIAHAAAADSVLHIREFLLVSLVLLSNTAQQCPSPPQL